MELGNVLTLSYEELACYTDDFSDSNYIGRFQFGKTFRGKIVRAEGTQYVMVKIWEVPKIYRYEPGDNESRLMDEIILLSHEMLINHPGIVKLYGYCFEGDHLGVVYQFKPFDSVFNLAPKDGFTWLQRIKVALAVASLLNFLHSEKCSSFKPFVVRNLSCSHIVLDEDYNPKLCDFGLISGGIFPDRRIYRHHHVLGCHGYIDFSACARGGEFEYKKDVYAFAVILLGLISKKVYNEEDFGTDALAVDDWAVDKFLEHVDSDGNLKEPKYTLVHESLAADPDFDPVDGHKISALAIECVTGLCYERPSITQVLRSLHKLKVVKEHADFLGAKVEYGL